MVVKLGLIILKIEWAGTEHLVIPSFVWQYHMVKHLTFSKYVVNAFPSRDMSVLQAGNLAMAGKVAALSVCLTSMVRCKDVTSMASQLQGACEQFQMWLAARHECSSTFLTYM